MSEAVLAAAARSGAPDPSSSGPGSTGVATAESVGRRAGELAHDLNNLLTVILGGTAALRLDLPEGPLLEVVDEIEAAGRRANELAQQLLRLSRPSPVPVIPPEAPAWRPPTPVLRARGARQEPRGEGSGDLFKRAADGETAASAPREATAGRTNEELP